LLQATEVFRGVQSGVADVAYWVPGATGSPEEISTLSRLPFTGVKSPKTGTAVAAKLFATSPEIRSEYMGLEVMGITMMSLYWMHTVNKPVHVPADVKGMKVIANTGWADYTKNIGGAPISTGISDWYMSLERGLAEGQWAHFPVCRVVKTPDLLKYHTKIGASKVSDCIIVNNATRDRLSPDLQAIVKEAAEWQVGEAMKADDSEEQKGIQYAKDKGDTFYYPNPEELKQWDESTKPLHDSRLGRFDKEGLPAKKVYERWMQLVKEYKE
jgi:TRAP-type C4-dicarboxylate transport system substrate-binding protein